MSTNQEQIDQGTTQNTSEQENKSFEDLIREWKEKLQTNIDEQLKEAELNESMKEALDISSAIVELQKRQRNLQRALVVLKKEELLIDLSYEDKIKELNSEEKKIKVGIDGLIDSGLEKTTQKQLLNFIGEASKYNKGLEYKYIAENLTEQQKVKIHEILNSQPIKNQDDKKMAREFQNQIGYSMDFAEENLYKDIPEELKVFVSWLKDYKKELTSNIDIAFGWLEEIFYLRFNEERAARFTEAALRNFEIGFDIENEEEKAEIQKKAAKEFFELLKNNAPYYGEQ